MKYISAFATIAAALGAGPAVAQADFSGANLNFSYVYPTSLNVYTSSGYVVGSGVEIINVAGDRAITLDISSNSLLVEFDRASTWTNYPFNGWILSDQVNGLNDITGVSINSATNWGAFNQSHITFTANSISVNWAGLAFDPTTTLLLDVTFASAVPEPAAWAMMLLGFGAIGYAMRRRRSLRLMPSRPSAP